MEGSTMSDNETILQLRRFSPDDLAAILAWPQSVTEARWWAGPQTVWPIPIEVVQRWHADPDVHPYLLVNGSMLLGYGELWIDVEEQEVELARIIIAPAHRRQGLGVAFVRLLLEEVRNTAYKRFLRVFPDNHVAMNCYVRAGFTQVNLADQETFNQGQPIKYVWMSYSDQRDKES